MTTSLLLLAAGILVAALLSSRRRSRLPLPPGPRKLPIVGNLFNVPSTFPWEAYARLSKEYNSDIIHLDLVGKSIVILNSFEATTALFEKRSAIYSDRQVYHTSRILVIVSDFNCRDSLPMVNDLMGWSFTIGTMKYGDDWRIHRRLANRALSFKTSRKYEPHEQLATRKLLKRMVSDPDAFFAHFRQMAGELTMAFTYGIDVLPSKDPYVTLAQDAVHTWAAALVPGLYLVDTFPILKHVPSWFPGAGFKRKAREWRKLSWNMAELPFAETKRQMQLDQESGIAPSSFTADALNASKDATEPVFYQERHVRSTAATMYVGGADTTVSALGTFVLAMLSNPEAQSKAQAEIDSVIGGDALPTFEDRDSLPYVSALINEVLRWNNVTPMAVPRLLTVEDEYKGYRIPAGSVVIGNAWGLLHDETVYPNPHAFKPERFLLPDGRLDPSVRDPGVAFGFGRRLCPGRHMATSSIWITVTSMLATLNIKKAVGCEPSYQYTSAIISEPLPFKCVIEPRSSKAAALIQSADTDTRRA
ncbi:cytochrome P450 [Roridomyces roridus]|uniref:Cytochrome P450 n=1 Tax=Roridomyces roridus TaxID=1738132 RepID=A0AAD7BN75_9AGAR|nr:cytochrome P450 [Roridomyces roridus]